MQARRTRGDQVDVELVKEWIRLSQERCEHSQEESSELVDLGLDLYVIDVEHGCLVRLPHAKRYVALSYVWGPATSPHLRWTEETIAQMFTPRGLHAARSGDIPTTICDAMTMCSVLDLQYLWVDAVCIQQDDSQAKSKNIAVMDAIYNNAFITFVSAAGKDAWAGLPGVEPRSRHFVQNVEDIGSLTLANAS